LFAWLLIAIILLVVSPASGGECNIPPGDAKADGYFGPEDLDQVISRGKYLTGQLATWGDGDWNGGAAIDADNLPAGDGVFDHKDMLVVAFVAKYLVALDFGVACDPVEVQFDRLVPGGRTGDNRASIVYDAATGAMAWDSLEGRQLGSIYVESATGIFTNDRPQGLDGDFDIDTDHVLFKVALEDRFWTLYLGEVAQVGLSEEFIIEDLIVTGTLAGGGWAAPDLIYVPVPQLLPGDANQDLQVDQSDIVQVLQAAKYLTGAPATWGEGDWNGAPGGSTGNPPPGDGLFNQLDIIAALNTGVYLTGPYAAVRPNGSKGDGQTSVGYNPRTGEVFVDAPAGVELTSINIDSAAGLFTGQAPMNLGGSFDNDADGNIFKATFGGSFGSLSFGNVAQTGLTKQFLLSDLSIVGWRRRPRRSGPNLHSRAGECYSACFRNCCRSRAPMQLLAVVHVTVEKILLQPFGSLLGHLALPQVPIAKVRHAYQMFQSAVADLGTVQIEVDNVVQTFQMLQTVVGNLGQCQVQSRERREVHKVGQAIVGDLSILEVQLDQFVDRLQMDQPVVGQLRPAQVEGNYFGIIVLGQRHDGSTQLPNLLDGLGFDVVQQLLLVGTRKPLAEESVNALLVKPLPARLLDARVNGEEQTSVGQRRFVVTWRVSDHQRMILGILGRIGQRLRFRSRFLAADRRNVPGDVVFVPLGSQRLAGSRRHNQ
jgi:hypothetical protein